MANNVYSTIRFESGNIDSEREFLRVFTAIEGLGERGLQYADFLPKEDVLDASYMDHFIGPRIANITEFMGTKVSITSAWISPDVFFDELTSWIQDVDPHDI